MSSNNSLLSIDSKIIKYGLERTFQLLEACDNPHLATECIQIVGTNGKGSISAMLSNVLIKNKYDVGLYTSPHLVDLNERIRFNDQKISNTSIDYFTKKFKSNITIIQPSFFEIMTVMALEYFKQKKANIAINTADTRTSRFTGGERIDCAIADLDIEKRKVTLSIKLLEEIEKKEALEKYGAEGSGKNLPFSSLSEDLKKKNKK